jgi:hypothetical protein
VRGSWGKRLIEFHCAAVAIIGYEQISRIVKPDPKGTVEGGRPDAYSPSVETVACRSLAKDPRCQPVAGFRAVEFKQSLIGNVCYKQVASRVEDSRYRS